MLVRRCASAGRVLMMSAGNSGKTAKITISEEEATFDEIIPEITKNGLKPT